ncbi:hypothetical protein FCV60_03325 [Vibrio sp. F13]|uniref:ATP-dependent DNA helicase n=1 Tax=Vibrio sp. F13 TaxID=2070777 RepID=UPI0010BDD100|nr:AAA family ATPase [Vibrio sp. F13]TKF56937.1 hypothetical protein FCV60_03325 [Vibrio sp. F13]
MQTNFVVTSCQKDELNEAYQIYAKCLKYQKRLCITISVEFVYRAPEPAEIWQFTPSARPYATKYCLHYQTNAIQPRFDLIMTFDKELSLLECGNAPFTLPQLLGHLLDKHPIFYRLGCKRKRLEKTIKAAGSARKFIKILTEQNLSALSVAFNNPKRALAVMLAFNNLVNEFDYIEFIQSTGYDIRTAKYLYELLGLTAKQSLLQNPYLPLQFGAKFVNAWGVAERINKQSPCSPKYRFLGAIDTVVYRALANGHTAIPIDEFNQKLGSLINKNNVDNAVQIALSERTLCKSSDETAYQGIGVAYIESKTEMSIQRLIKQADFYLSQARFDQLISEFNILVNFALTHEQVNLVEKATTQHLTVAQGVSGSGKSTALSAIKYICNHDERDSYYLALSAVATKRIRKSLIKHKVIREKRKGLVAKTVMEECCFTLRSFINKLTSSRLKLKNNCLIVVDEASMCDLSIISELLHALESHDADFSLLMVGDVAQVAPVGFGAVFQPLVEARINYVELTSSLRQSTNNPIQNFATLVRTVGHKDTKLNEHEIDFKKEPNAHLPPYQSKLNNGVFKLACTNQDIPATCSKLLIALGIYETQIITPFSTYKQFVSVDEINEACMLTINPEGRKTFGFRQGDKVIVTRNNEELGLYNGDMGVVLRIVHEYNSAKKLIKKLICNLNETQIELDEEHIAQVGLNHSYAVTIHKAQGSEFKYTIVVIPSWDSALIENSLIYTALTRSTEATIFVGDIQALNRAINRTPNAKSRYLGFTPPVGEQFRVS